MDYTYGAYNTGYGVQEPCANYYGGLNVGFPTYSTMPYLYNGEDLSQSKYAAEKQTESKPRFSKEEVQHLEDHFDQDPKPPRTIKRQLADRMRVELPRINNWFQNRRAKAKQERKQEEYRASQEVKTLAESQSPANEQVSSVQEHFLLSNQQAPLEPCVAVFSSSSASENMSDPPESVSQASTYNSPIFDDGNAHQSQFSEPAIAMEAYLTPAASDGSMIATLDCTTGQEDVSPYDNLSPCSKTCVPDFDLSIDVQPSQLGIPRSSSMSQTTSECSVKLESLEDSSCNESTSPSLALSQPAPSEFKPPPPASNLAHRRNRRPLDLDSQYPSHIGLQTTSGEFFRRSDANSPIRRIASATGFPPSRIMKQSATSPRSPMYSEKKQNALLQSLQSARSPSFPCITMNATVGPPTPRTPLCIGQQGLVEATSTSDDEARAYNFQLPQLTTNLHGPVVETPPATPGVASFQEGMYVSNDVGKPLNYVMAHDTPLFTPNGLYNNLTAPEYVRSGLSNQSITPSCPPSMEASYLGPASASSEFIWPDSSLGYAPSIQSSPGSTNNAFQFTPNMTPQTYGGL